MKVIRLIIFTLAVLILSTDTVLADELTPVENAKKSLTNAFDDLINGNTLGYYNQIIDERYNEQEALELYNLEVANNPIVDYRITKSEKIDDKTYSFDVLHIYKSEEQVIYPITVKEKDDNWKILISDTPLEMDEYNVVKETNDDYYKNQESTGLYNESGQGDGDGIAPMSTTWRTFTYNMKSSVRSSEFERKPPTTGLRLNIREQHMFDGGGVRYKVFGRTSTGNTTIGNKLINGNKKNYSVSYSLSTRSPSSYTLEFIGFAQGSGGYNY
ncbi:hypothetical protein [Oceanobacillus sp. 1P07AA]|uniref:hypothetical protein n=1 Tax=Oceanobacillus sp. 1P07AA TaxID=3132293 RepID=UPI0039A59520